ncbi:MAG: alpha/beta hydrolase [Acidimicrobiia bacterium]|nr:alpha/beta hydrolase [Acidimicrobiia bacterium]
MNGTAEVPISARERAQRERMWLARLDVDAVRQVRPPEAARSDRSGPARLAAGLERVLSLPLSAILLASSPDTILYGMTKAESLLERWSFYASPRFASDTSAFFHMPPSPAAVEVSPARHILATPERGTVVDVRFPSTFVPVNPALRDGYVAGVRNRTVHARWWRHAAGPRPTIVCIHGFQAGSHLINVEFFDVRSLYVDGYDVALIQLPFHGPRAEFIDGWSYLSLDVAHLAEVIAHSVSDVRALLSHLFESGVPQAGVKGVSLGGYLAALLAAVDARLAFSIPVAAPASLPDLIADLSPFGHVLTLLLRGIGWDLDDLRRHMACHTPLQYPSRLDSKRHLIVATQDDRLVRPYHAHLLGEHWKGAAVAWRRGSHQIHLNRRAYRVRLGEFLSGIGFEPEAVS